MVVLLMMDQSIEAIYKLCALIALLGLASPRDNNKRLIGFERGKPTA